MTPENKLPEPKAYYKGFEPVLIDVLFVFVSQPRRQPKTQVID
jgi:hypothetical protein